MARRSENSLSPDQMSSFYNHMIWMNPRSSKQIIDALNANNAIGVSTYAAGSGGCEYRMWKLAYRDDILQQDQWRIVLLPSSFKLKSSRFTCWGTASSQPNLPINLGNLTYSSRYKGEQLNSILLAASVKEKTKNERIYPNRTHQKQWQSVALGASTALMGMQAAAVTNNFAGWDFGSSDWGIYSTSLSTTISLAVPGLASVVLLAHRWINNGELVGTDVADATQWFLNTAGAVAGLSVMNTMAAQWGITAAGDFIKDTALSGAFVLNGGLEQVAVLVSQTVLTGVGMAAGLAAMHLITSMFRAGLEKSIEAYQIEVAGESACAKTARVMNAFFQGAGVAGREFFSKDTLKLFGAVLATSMVGFALKLVTSALVASGVLTGGMVPLAMILAGLITVAGHYWFMTKARPKSEIQKIVEKEMVQVDPGSVSLYEDEGEGEDTRLLL